MRRSNSHPGRGRLVVDVAILGALVYLGIKTIPVYIQNYELTSYMRQLAIQASAKRSPARDIENQVVAFADSLDLPVGRNDVRVGVGGGKVTIALEYSVPVDLKVYTWVLHFAPSTDSRFL